MQLCPVPLLLQLLRPNQLLLLIAALLRHLHKVKSVKLLVLQVDLVLLMFLGALNKLIGVALLLVLVRDQFAGETLVAHTHLIDLLLVDICQNEHLLRECRHSAAMRH